MDADLTDCHLTGRVIGQNEREVPHLSDHWVCSIYVALFDPDAWVRVDIRDDVEGF